MSTFSHSGYGDLPCLPRASISQSRSGPSSSANGGEDLSGEERAAASRAKVEQKRREATRGLTSRNSGSATSPSLATSQSGQEATPGRA